MGRFKEKLAFMVEQLVECSLPKPDILSSNPGTSNFNFCQQSWKRKKQEIRCRELFCTPPQKKIYNPYDLQLCKTTQKSIYSFPLFYWMLIGFLQNFKAAEVHFYLLQEYFWPKFKISFEFVYFLNVFDVFCIFAWHEQQDTFRL